MYAHVVMEHGGIRYEVGSTIPARMPGLAALVAAGAASEDPPVIQIASYDAAGFQEESF